MRIFFCTLRAKCGEAAKPTPSFTGDGKGEFVTDPHESALLTCEVPYLPLRLPPDFPYFRRNCSKSFLRDAYCGGAVTWFQVTAVNRSASSIPYSKRCSKSCTIPIT